MSQGHPRTLCPICSSPAVPVLTDAQVFLRRGSTKKVGARLRVFHCDAASHIFFVRCEDLARDARDRTSETRPPLAEAS